MDIMLERSRIDRLLLKEPIERRNKVIQRIENFKLFSGIEIITDNLNYIVYNELQKVLEEEKR